MQHNVIQHNIIQHNVIQHNVLCLRLRMARQKERRLQRDIAVERVGRLMSQAEELSLKDPEAASERIRLAKAICLRCNVRMRKDLRLRFCPKCLTYRTQDTVRCRLNPRMLRMEHRCLICGHKTNHPYVREKRGKTPKESLE